MAGLDYPTPWTRDAAINTLFAAAEMMPDIAKNTLLSVLETRDGEPCISGQYWDRIIWALGAEKLIILTDVLGLMREHDLEPKRLRFVQGRSDKAPKLFLVEAKRGAKPGYMDVLPALIIEDENGFTPEMRAVYGCYKDGYDYG